MQGETNESVGREFRDDSRNALPLSEVMRDDNPASALGVFVTTARVELSFVQLFTGVFAVDASVYNINTLSATSR
jgi:hypothetical protein